MIHFPVIRRLEIKNYELFQNDHSEGIGHAFPRGVHAVVGINGLGKTTLLTMLYRALLGPYDQSKSDDVGLLGSQHKLSDWRNKDFFRDRVKDKAAKATIEIDVTFGASIITVRRRLNTLQIEHLAIDGVVSETKKANILASEYEDAVVRFSGVANYFDYFAVLRYLVFFLEDRVELIWDRRSQFDMLRVLLFDTESAGATSNAYDEAQAADSRFRSRRFIVGKDRDRLEDAERAAGNEQASEFRALQTAITEADARDREQAQGIELARQNVDAARLRRERALLDLQEARVALEMEEQAHYKHLFPNLGQTAEHVFLNILGDGGCLVCGSTGPEIVAHLKAKIEEHRCPVCDSPAEKHEKIVASADFSRARLRRLKQKVDQLRAGIEQCTAEIDQVENEYEQLVVRRDEDRSELLRLRVELNKMGFTEIPTDDELASLRTVVREGEKELERLLQDRTDAEGRYGRLVRRQKAAIDEAVGAIRRRFRHYAGMVLAERCELRTAEEERSIGQEGREFKFPYFEVMMTSGVFDQSLSSRSNKDAVSESQGEFLDVAFRLALIDAVTGRAGDSMMVVETPESSLDSLFVSMVGETFRSYGENQDRNNVFIASTNLNNEEMLSALMGISRTPRVERASRTNLTLRPRQSAQIQPAPVVPAGERPSRIINLLELAAPNAALRDHRAYYRKLFRRALAPRRAS